MIIVNLTYIKPMTEINALTDAHRAVLAGWAKDNILICSGPKEPRTGGVMIFNLPTIEAVEKLMEADPFWREGMATYEYIVFTPIKCADGFNAMLGKAS